MDSGSSYDHRGAPRRHVNPEQALVLQRLDDERQKLLIIDPASSSLASLCLLTKRPACSETDSPDWTHAHIPRENAPGETNVGGACHPVAFEATSHVQGMTMKCAARFDAAVNRLSHASTGATPRSALTTAMVGLKLQRMAGLTRPAFRNLGRGVF
jgi:hypothetical protein